MELNKKGQISIIEIAVVLALFAIFSVYFSTLVNPSPNDFKLQADSLLDAIYYSEDYRTIIMQEDLSSVSISQNWDEINSIINNSIANYEIQVSSNSEEKIIISCSETYYKVFSEKVISIEDNDNFEFRKIRLGVCY